MSEVKIMPIGEFRRDLEKRLERSIRACRIVPELTDQLQPLINSLKTIQTLEAVGVEYVSIDKPDDGKYIRPPYPREIEEFYRMAGKKSINVGRAYASNNKAYVKIREFGRDLYAVIPASSPPDPLGEPDMDYNGLRLYSAEKVRRYVEWCSNYIRDVLANLYEVDERDIIELEKVMPREGELGYMWLDVASILLEYFDGYFIVLDEGLRSRGVEVIRIPYISNKLYSWIVERSGGRLYESLVAVLEPSIAEEVESRWLGEKHWEALRYEFMERLIQEYRVSEGVLRMPFEKLLEIPEVWLRFDSVEQVRSFIEEYCDGLYLLNDLHFSPTMPSIRHPLKILYLYWLARNHGLNADLVARRNNRGQIYVRLLRSVFSSHDGWWDLAVKPRRDLKIEYRYDARIEDGCLLIVCDDIFKSQKV